MTENKTKPTSVTADDFIAGIENPRLRADVRVALIIYEEVTGLPPVVWGQSIIGFGLQSLVHKIARQPICKITQH
jgi:hypothetical protein